MEVIQFILFSIVLILAWKYVFLKTRLDRARDDLFDLRDRLRADFVAKDWPLSADGYKQSRDIINSHLRFIEDMSVWRILYIQVKVLGDENLQATLKEKKGQMLLKIPEDQAKYIENLRKVSLQIVVDFGISNSPILLLLGVMLWPLVFIALVFKVTKNGCASFFKAAIDTVMHFRKTSSYVADITGKKVAEFFLRPAVVEQCSFANNRLAIQS